MDSAGCSRSWLIMGLCCFIVASAANVVRAQAVETEATPDLSRSGALYDELAQLDSAVFDASFITCDPEKANAMFTEDVEFYHDKTGFQAGAAVHANTKRLTESCPRERGITRELVAGSLQVFPIKDFGAVQMGEHRFIERDSATTTIAKFVHLWKKEEGKWRLSRVLSFDHQSQDLGATRSSTR